MSFLDPIQPSASEDRLEKLIQERLKPGVNKDQIDAQIWELFGEDWAVMFTDLSGFSRGVAEFGIIHFLQVIYESERILVPVIEKNHGILLKVEGDSLLVIFRAVENALTCAIEMQKALEPYNVGRSAAEKILLCVGLGFGRVLKIGNRDVFGAEVNAASKLGEDTAKSGEILVTENVKIALETSGYRFESIDFIPPGAKAAHRVLY